MVVVLVVVVLVRGLVTLRLVLCGNSIWSSRRVTSVVVVMGT